MNQRQFRRWRKLFTRFPFLRTWILQLKKFSLPGFGGVPIWDVAGFFIGEIQRESLAVRASNIAFNFFIAIFPAIIFLFTLIPYIPIDNLQAEILGLLSDLFPEDAYQLVMETANDIIAKPRGGLLSLGFFMALYFSTNGMVAISNSFDKHYNSTFSTRNFIQTRMIAVLLTVVLASLLLMTIVLITAGNTLLQVLLERMDILSSFSLILLNLVRWIAILLMMFFSYSFIYYFGPAVKKKFTFISTGSTLATILTILISLGFSYYVNNFGQYNKLYGSIGTIIALLLWIYMNAFALLIGFELNASIGVNKDLRRLRKSKYEPETFN